MAQTIPTFTPTHHNKAYEAIDPTIHPELSVSGKSILITGGGKGIGEAIALHFARAGARALVLTGRTAASLESCKAKIAAQSPATQVEAIAVDITDSAGITEAFRRATSRFGPIDVLVNNAAYLPDEHTSVAASPLDDYWRAFEVNVKGGLIVTQAFLQPGIAVDEGATVININSAVAHIPYIPGYSAYGGSKLAFAKIMEYVQIENEHRRLRVFSLQPGAIETDMSRKAGNIETRDDIGKSCKHYLFQTSNEKRMEELTISRTPGCSVCLACEQRRRLPPREVPVGKLGRGRAEGEKAGDIRRKSAHDYSEWVQLRTL